MKIYSGSGILPFIILNKNIYLITFTQSTGIINDAGGKKENNHNIIQTACRELFEESAGLIQIDENEIMNNSIYFDIKYNNKYYRLYTIIIDNVDIDNVDIDIDYYDINLKKFKKFNYNPFTETHGIKLMKINTINIIDNKIKLTSNNNFKLLLAPRLSSIIKKILKKYNNLTTFYKYLKKNVNVIKLKKIALNINTYEYNTNKKIKIKNITTYSNIIKLSLLK
jgi:hypothetical protein